MSFQGPRVRILIFSPNSSGGIAEHTYYQARALTEAGAEVECLVGPDFLEGRDFSGWANVCLPRRSYSTRTGLWKNVHITLFIVSCNWSLLLRALRVRPDLVLLDSYMEYLSPLWAFPHWALARWLGIRYAANLHDPVRDYRIGPVWWHTFSVWLAFRPLSFVLVHQRLPEPSPVPPGVVVVEAPVGVYDLRPSVRDPRNIRESWNIPEEACVFLAFGFIRDNKNLDLFIRAMSGNDRARLVVMGRTQSSKDRSVEYYRKVAADAGVLERVAFYDAFVPDDMVGVCFAAADVAVLTYDATFRSQSGVLNIAARARRPVLASAGDSPLQTSVAEFRLGIFVEPDCLEALSAAIAQFCAGRVPEPNWSGYERYASWSTNAQCILNGLAASNRPQI